MNNEELKPCPFCGGEACKIIEEVSYSTPQYSVQCQNCKFETLMFDYEAEAVAAWNRRNYPVFPDSSKLTYADVEKMVKPLEWHEGAIGWVSHILHENFVIEQTGEHEFCVNKVGYYNSLEEAKAVARGWIVDLVADALGVERSGE